MNQKVKHTFNLVMLARTYEFEEAAVSDNG